MIRQVSFSVLSAILAVCFAPADFSFAQTAPQAASQQAPGGETSFKETPIGEITPGSVFKDLVISRDHIAWVEESSGKKTVRLDGTSQGGPYDDVRFMRFGRETSNLMFFAKRGSSWTLVVNGKEPQQTYDDPSSIALQPGGSSYAFVGCREKKCQLTVDGVASGPVYENSSYVRYSRDGKRLAFLGKRGKKWIAVVDGKETGPELDELSGSAWGFARDGSRFYSAARQNGKWTYFVDGVPGPGFEVLSPIAFSPDGKHYAYGGTVTKGGMKKTKTIGTMVIDGTPGELHEGSGMAGYLSNLGGYSEEIITGVREMLPDFYGVSTPWFNSEGKLAYAISRNRGDNAVLVDGKEGPGFERILSPVVSSSDGVHFAYIAQSSGEFVEVHDHQAGKTYSLSKMDGRILEVPWIESKADGSHLAFEIASGGQMFHAGGTVRALRSVVIDGKTGPEYDVQAIEDFGTTDDSRHFCYAVYGTKDGRALVNVDGHESRTYNSVGGMQISDEGKSVKFVAIDDKKLLRVIYPLK